MSDLQGAPEPSGPPLAGNYEISTKTIVAAWMEPHLRQREMSKARLAAAIGASPSQLSNWLSGREHIPERQQLMIGEALDLSPAQQSELIQLSDIVTRLGDLDRIFLAGLRRVGAGNRARHDDELGAVFDYPARIVARLLEEAARMAAQDIAVQRDRSAIFHILNHVRAAHNVAHDLNAWLRDDQGQLFTARNFRTHLSYPTVHYIGFFLTRVGAADGAEVETFRMDLNRRLDDYLLFLGSGDPLDKAIANHALHILARFGDPEYIQQVRRHAQNSNRETVRMALFAQVFGSVDGGPAEELVRRILNDADFGDVTVLFDGLHFGDYTEYLNERFLGIIPIRALMRQIEGMASDRDYVREISAARAINIVNHFGNQIRSNAEAMEKLAGARARLIWLKAEESTVAEARDTLLDLLEDPGGQEADHGHTPH